MVSADDKAKVEAAVKAAEQTTSGEIVPMVVSRSSVYGHVLPLTSLLLLAIGLGAGELVRALAVPLPDLAFPLGVAVLTLAAWPLSHLELVRRALTPNHDLDAQVRRRAALEFHAAGLDQTSGGTGVLILVSLAERRAVVLADKTIAQHLPDHAWDDVIKRLLAGLARGDLGAGFCDAIKHCGTLLAPHFPASDKKLNELADALIVKD